VSEDTGAPRIAPWGTPYPLGFEAIDEDQDWLDRRLWGLAATEHAEDSGCVDRHDDSRAPRAHVICIDIALESVLPNRKRRKQLSLFHSVLELLGGG